jgi:hypothetical protein
MQIKMNLDRESLLAIYDQIKANDDKDFVTLEIVLPVKEEEITEQDKETLKKFKIFDF